MLWITVDNKKSPECLSMHFSIHTKKLNREKNLEIHKKDGGFGSSIITTVQTLTSSPGPGFF